MISFQTWPVIAIDIDLVTLFHGINIY